VIDSMTEVCLGLVPGRSNNALQRTVGAPARTVWTLRAVAGRERLVEVMRRLVVLHVNPDKMLEPRRETFTAQAALGNRC
jgi:hypothetical protein